MGYGFIFKTAALAWTLVASASAKPEIVKLTNPDGSSAEISVFGAQVLSFRTAKNPKLDVLFMSKKSFMDCVQPIRGGIPIIFPNFGSRTDFPSHGFARRTNWTVGEIIKSTGKGVPTVVNFTMVSSETTRKIWPVDFELKYEVKLFANQLVTALHVTNTFKEKIEFNALLHNYLYVDDVRNKGVQVSGLKKTSYFDKVTKLNSTETRDPIFITAEIDNVYKNAPSMVSAKIKGISNVDRTVEVKKEGFISSKTRTGDVKTPTDCVLWNPWSDRAKTMKDFDAEEYKNMVAIEPGRVSELQPLLAGETYTLLQAITVSTK